VQTQSGAAMIDDGTDLAISNLCRNNKRETAHSDVVQNNSAANINTNKTALRIIIDLPSHYILYYILHFSFFI
jgi:hypothetical protein